MYLPPNYYNSSLTYDNAFQSDCEWIEDVKKLELLSDSERAEQIENIKVHDYLIGQSKHDVPQGQNCGLYHKFLPELQIDDTLTPENAKNRGFEWVGDVTYDREAPLVMMQEIIDFVEKEGYKLGKSATLMAADVKQGLYEPVKNR